MIRRVLHAALAAVLFASCAVGPNYKRPAIETPRAWNNGPTAEKGFALENWWEVFSDPMLNSLERRALERNWDLKSAFAHVTESRALARASAADLFPSVSSGPSGSWNSASALVPSVLSPHQLTHLYNAPLDLSYELDIWGKIRRYFEAARGEAYGAYEDYRTVLLTLTSDVASNYFLLRAYDSEKLILLRAIDSRKGAFNVNKSRFDAGIIPAIDVARAKVELSTTESDLADLLRRRAQAESSLAVLLGFTPADFKRSQAELNQTPPVIPAGLPSELLKRRPDVLSAEHQLGAECARIGVAVAEFFPSIHLTGQAGFQSTDLANIFTWPAHSYSFGPSIHIPIFEGGRNLANYKAAKARYEKALALYHKQILIAFKDVEDSLIDLKYRREQIEAENRAIEAAEEAFKLAQLRYRRGISNYLEVIDAERSFLDAAINANRLRQEQFLTTIRLIKALGGGWT